MAPMPAHSLSWRGSPVTFDLQFQGQGRMREVCHTNEYVGMLRIRVGQQLGVSPRSIRLFLAGKHRADRVPWPWEGFVYFGCCALYARSPRQVWGVHCTSAANRDCFVMDTHMKPLMRA